MHNLPEIFKGKGWTVTDTGAHFSWMKYIKDSYNERDRHSYLLAYRRLLWLAPRRVR